MCVVQPGGCSGEEPRLLMQETQEAQVHSLGRWEDKSGDWDRRTHSTMYKIDNEQRPTV